MKEQKFENNINFKEYLSLVLRIFCDDDISDIYSYVE